VSEGTLRTAQHVHELSVHTLIGAELGRRYGITDLDGKQPIDFRADMGAPHPPFTKV
jgi:hypothetical protein